MAELKTKKTKVSVATFLAAVENPQRRADAKVVQALMREATGEEPAMWGPSIIGFGSYRYVYASGHSGEWPIVGFSPRKANLVLYLAQASKQREPLLKELGKHKTGKACVYVTKLADVDLDVLRRLIADSVAHVRATHECGACKEPAAKAKKKTGKTTKRAARTTRKAAKTKAAKTTKKASKTKASKTKAGKTKAGKTKAGKTKAGKTKAGKTKAGKTKAGKTKAAKTKAGKTKAAKTKAAKTKAAKTTKKAAKTTKKAAKATKR